MVEGFVPGHQSRYTGQPGTPAEHNPKGAYPYGEVETPPTEPVVSEDRHAFTYEAFEGSGSTEYVHVYFEELGDMTITYETRPFSGGARRPVISLSGDFPVTMVDIIDPQGNDRTIC